jgi:hypothetical protein
MSDGDRGNHYPLIGAGIGVFLLLLGGGIAHHDFRYHGAAENRPQERQSADDKADEQKKPIAIPAPVYRGLRPEERVAAEIAHDKSNPYARPDLEAQQGMVIAAALQLILSFLGIILVWRTLRVNAAATKAATDQAKAAERQLALMQTLERPYLFAIPREHEDIFRPVRKAQGALQIKDFDPDGWTYVAFRNHGKAPAFLISWNWRRQSRWASQGLPPPLVSVVNPGNPIPHGVVSVPGTDSQEFRATTTRTWEEAGPNSEHDIEVGYLIGFVVYRDMFGNRYRAGFGLRWASEGRWELFPSQENADHYNYDFPDGPKPEDKD